MQSVAAAYEINDAGEIVLRLTRDELIAQRDAIDDILNRMARSAAEAYIESLSRD